MRYLVEKEGNKKVLVDAFTDEVYLTQLDQFLETGKMQEVVIALDLKQVANLDLILQDILNKAKRKKAA